MYDILRTSHCLNSARVMRRTLRRVFGFFWRCCCCCCVCVIFSRFFLLFLYFSISFLVLCHIFSYSLDWGMVHKEGDCIHSKLSGFVKNEPYVTQKRSSTTARTPMCSQKTGTNVDSCAGLLRTTSFLGNWYQVGERIHLKFDIFRRIICSIAWRARLGNMFVFLIRDEIRIWLCKCYSDRNSMRRIWIWMGKFAAFLADDLQEIGLACINQHVQLGQFPGWFSSHTKIGIACLSETKQKTFSTWYYATQPTITWHFTQNCTNYTFGSHICFSLALLSFRTRPKLIF